MSNSNSTIDKPLGSEFMTPVGKVRVVRTNYRVGAPCDMCALQGRTHLCKKYECIAQRRTDNIPVYFEKV